MGKTPFRLLVFGCLLWLVAGLPAGGETWRVGTVAPANSPWTDALHQLARHWARLSGGRIELKIYPGGAAGDESDLIRKMRIGQLQGAALTSLGLNRLAPAILSLSIPFLIREPDELQGVLERLKPSFEGQLAAEGFQVAAWAQAGWIHFFGRAPVVYPKDLKRLKLAVPAGDQEQLEAWQRMGFQAIALPLPDFLAGLQTGMVDALYSPPVAVASFLWFGSANHMSAMPVAPVIGGILITRTAWERVPQELRPALLEAAREVGRGLDRRMEELEEEALREMQKHGLVVDPVPAEARREWQELAQQAVASLTGKVFSAQTYEQIRNYLADLRRKP